jgi:hypothetical protein
LQQIYAVARRLVVAAPEATSYDIVGKATTAP